MCDGYTGHRTPVILRATVEDEIRRGPLQVGTLHHLTIEAPLEGSENFKLEYGHISLVLRMVDFKVLEKSVGLNPAPDISFVDTEAIYGIPAAFASVHTGFAGLLAECTLSTVQCPSPGVAGTFQSGLARPTAVVLFVDTVGEVLFHQCRLERNATGLYNAARHAQSSKLLCHDPL